MNPTNRVTDVKDRKAPLRLNEIFDARFERPTDHLKDTEVLPDLPDYSPEEEPFSFAVLPSLETTPAALPPADTVSGTPPAPKAASAPPGPAHVSPGSKVPGRVASCPFFASGPPLPATAPFVTIATPVPASASSCTTAPLALKFSPTNNKSIFASSVGSSISIAGTGLRRFSLQHIGLSETESKHIGEVAHAMPPVTPPKPLPPRSSVPRASGSMYRDHAKTPYSSHFRNASMPSSSSKSRASQQAARSLSAGAHLLASSPDMITGSVVVSDSLVANILALYHVNKMMVEFGVTICRLRDDLTFAVSGKINAVKSAVQELGALEVQVKGSLVKRSYPLECHYLPVFNKDLAKKIAAEIENPFCVQIEVASRSGILSLVEFCKAMEGFFSSKEATPASSLRDYLTTPHSHRWCEVVAGAQKEHDLPDDLNEALNLSYAPGKVVQVSYSGSKHELSVDFLKMTITVEQSHTNIKVSPSRWYRMDDNFGEVELDKALSEAIEAFILYGMPVVVDGKSYNVDLEKMKLTDKQSMEETLIKRDPQIGRLYTPALVVFLVSGLKEDVSKVSCKLQTLLNERTVKKDLPLTGPETIKNVVFSLARQYCVKISREKEKLVLESSPEYIEKVKSPIQSQYLELLAKSTTLPPHWDEMEGPIELKPVPASSTEFTRVLSLMKKTLLSAQIVKLERIQNQWLWEKYAFVKKRMEEKNGQEVNEKELFHGTSNTPPEKVYGSEQGFDFRFAANGMWGAGAYFAVNASYSDRYAYHANSNQKQILLASVLTGEAIECQPDKSLKKPPLKKAVKGSTFKDERYDSVTGTTNGSRIYVVYDHEKTYPSYLITYK